MSKASLVVLISGGGSNLQAIIDAIKSQQLNAEIKAVISNRDDAYGLKRAAKENIKTYVIDHRQFSSREAFDQAMIQIIDPLIASPASDQTSDQTPDHARGLVILAGFMRILSSPFIQHYQQRLINIHPSLLPKYKGLRTHQQALDNHDSVHGASVHYVDDELDSGPLVIQTEVPVTADDTAATLAQRVLEEEHKIYPLAIKLHCEGELNFDQNNLLYHGKPLLRPLLWKNGQLLHPA
ncbi:MAG: phosphoribosylglycinamide formyltransferase [Proteobacteria bacterium]|nr:phosphoribosylglycinamide formyltransferase [Pseudomonadota bacterium]